MYLTYPMYLLYLMYPLYLMYLMHPTSLSEALLCQCPARSSR